MGRVVNKSFPQVRRSIVKKVDKLHSFLEANLLNLGGDWTPEQNKTYEKLRSLCFAVEDEIDNLDEMEPPYEK